MKKSRRRQGVTESRARTERREIESRAQDDGAPGRRRTVLWLAVIAGATFAAFFPALRCRFTNWDDNFYVVENLAIRGFSAENLAAAFTTLYKGNWQPLTILSYMLDHALFGLDPRGYHATNLVLHILNSALVFFLVRMIARGAFAAPLTALLFALHPMRVESVAWIAERKDVLATAFFLLSLIFYVRRRTGAPRRNYALSFVCCLLSLTAKPMAVSLPFVLVLLDHLSGRAIDRKALAEKIPFLLLAIVFAILTLVTQKPGGAVADRADMPPLFRLLVGAHGLAYYPAKLLFPTGLSAYHPYPADLPSRIPAPLWFSAVAAALVAAAAWRFRRNRAVVFCLGFYVVTIAPVLQIIPVGSAIVAERYSYIPSIGLFLLAALGLDAALRATADRPLAAKTAIFVSVGLALSALGGLTFHRCGVWRDSTTLWSDVIEKHPQAGLAFFNRGSHNLQQGDLARAMPDLNRAIELIPDSAEQFSTRGAAHVFLGENEKALDDLDRALRLEPDHLNALVNRATVLLILGRHDEALADCERVLPRADEMGTNRAKAFLVLGGVHWKMKNHDEAIRWLDRALADAPDAADIHAKKGLVLLERGDAQQALGSFDAALALDPGMETARRGRAAASSAVRGNPADLSPGAP